MGSLLFKADPSYFLDDKAADRRFAVGFSPNMFDGFEWGALQTFCLKRGITQTQLNLLYRKWCTYPNAYLNTYRVRLDDIKEHYLKERPVIMELLGLFFPPCLLREYQALSPAFSHEQFSFARFVINSVVFCALPVPDLICALFSTIKQTAKAKRYLPADTPIPTVTFHHVVKVGLVQRAFLAFHASCVSRQHTVTRVALFAPDFNRHGEDLDGQFGGLGRAHLPPHRPPPHGPDDA